MMLRSYGPQRFWATNSTFPCDHQNQQDKPSLMCCVTWLWKLFSLSYDLFRRFYKLEPKLVNVTNWNRKLFKWTEEFYILMRILTFKKVYLIHGKQRFEWLWVFKPWFLSWYAGVTANLDPPRIWTPGPNPLADMDPPSQIWTPYQTFLLSILCIIFGN